MATEGEQAAVLAALAGVRKGDSVAAVGCGPVTQACLAAGSGQELPDPTSIEAGTVKVVVVGHAYDVPGALRLLAPGGRLVAVAADPGAAARVAEGAGLVLRHVERLGGQVAWSAQRPAAP
jgi:threonine dehydrogenase-like Zn-dependent dehydrogenase